MADGEKMETVTDFFSWAPESLQIMIVAMQLKDACSLERKLCLMHPAWAGDLFHPWWYTCFSAVLSGALGRPRGTGWGGRQEWGLGLGTHVNPWLIHVNVWHKPLQYCKVISLQLIKINGKKKNESYDQPRQYIKQQRHYFADKGPFSQSYGFSSSHVWMWYLDHKEGWLPKNWCFWTVVLEKILESPLDCKEIKPVHPKGNQPWIFVGMTVAEVETPISWPPDVKSWLIGKDPHAVKDWRQEKKGTTGDEMVGWHHWLNGLEFEQAPGDGEGQGSLACCSQWGCKESDTPEQLKNNNDGLESACQCSRRMFHPWSGKIPHATEHLKLVSHNCWNLCARSLWSTAREGHALQWRVAPTHCN